MEYNFKYTFAGCKSTNKTMTVTENKFLYYISASNIIKADKNGIVDIFFMENELSSINSLNDMIVCGDIFGLGYVMKKDEILKIFCDSKIQDCCFYNNSTVLFITMNTVVLYNFLHSKTESFNVDFFPTSICIYNEKILIGSALGVLYVFELKDNILTPIDQQCVHTDRILAISVTGNLIASASTDSNINIFKFEETLNLVQTLNGHSDWVNCLTWYKDFLISGSSDKSIRIWKRNEQNELYCDNIIGGSSGFYNVCCLDDKMIGHYKTGGIDKLFDFNGDNVDYPRYYITGHTDQVITIDYSKGLYLTCSADRTARLFYKNKECGRPTTHGFALSGAKFLPGNKLRFMCSGSETIMRVFETTQSFMKDFDKIKDKNYEGFVNSAEYATSSHLSELNLTNEVSNTLSHEPLSENALSIQVFREVKKIYGHYFEVKDIKVGGLILSCNRSATKKFAGLFVWSLDFEMLQYLTFHSLDIQKIAICNTNRYALTVSRDKTTALYTIVGKYLSLYKTFADHSRIIWDCGFSKDGKYFATCSRDCFVIIYKFPILSPLKRQFDLEPTSMDFSPTNKYLAVGFVNGTVRILNWMLEDILVFKAVGKRINALLFNEKGNELAIGGSDNLLRIIEIDH